MRQLPIIIDEGINFIWWKEGGLLNLVEDTMEKDGLSLHSQESWRDDMKESLLVRTYWDCERKF